jgi:hypothetical protein
VYRPDEWRARIFEVYNRKVAEHAQLFPIFHTFETAFRSTVAVTLEEYYRHPRWWRGIYEQLRKGNPATTIEKIGGMPITRDAAHLIGEIIFSIDGESLQKSSVNNFVNGYEFVECCDIGHIRQLIEKHWSAFSPRFSGTKRLTLNDFQKKFNRVRDARNDVYHHKSVARLAGVVATAEELLDYLNCSIGFVYRKITESTAASLKFLLPIEARHMTW